ncbi:MAG: phosphonoacetaldehyde hydrolase [Deltaproteobacteria bacterium]|nr:phosphonoacetaldehyde hydrolase [Deltaproteobacteria bacterium]
MQPTPLDLVIFDWAGTTVDHGCMSPIAPFLAVLAARGVRVEPAVARGPMGTHKRTHLERLCSHPEVLAPWRARFGRAPVAADVDAMFAELEPRMIATLPAFATPVAGCLETVAALRARGVRIGSTTGYTRRMMDVLGPAAAALGYAPDLVITADEVARARPFPDMCLRNVLALGASSVDRCVKVDDTVAGIEEGRRAGMWTVGVVMTGNEVGCDAATLAATSASERARLRRDGAARLKAAGAHVVIDGVADLLPALDALGRLGCGTARAA